VPSRGENDRMVSKDNSEWFLPSRMTHLQGTQCLKGHLGSADVSLQWNGVCINSHNLEATTALLKGRR